MHDLSTHVVSYVRRVTQLTHSWALTTIQFWSNWQLSFFSIFFSYSNWQLFFFFEIELTAVSFFEFELTAVLSFRDFTNHFLIRQCATRSTMMSFDVDHSATIVLPERWRNESKHFKNQEQSRLFETWRSLQGSPSDPSLVESNYEWARKKCFQCTHTSSSEVRPTWSVPSFLMRPFFATSEY